ncbi:DUF1127 domain-containing protein [Roseomonas sp. M0104]|uniref:DUF1127 domain-containing protein n=1 Tax=Teichococcus coralli TaxID=2545983 RepID=A0A845BD54_9PROT|nr:DUF1127 domain-containing protein [Pseudoroseomonas coralli]MXP64046.1 DUF1127 domain-containing protein [Pseudoroseomonas coralli]
MAIINSLFSMLSLWRERAWGRRQLQEMDTHMLRDIGLSHGAAAMEAAKPWWRD